MTKNGFFWVVMLCSIASCRNEDSPKGFAESVKIRLASEPDRLNPMLSSQSEATQIERWIFNPLQEYNPNTLELEPVLLERSPQVSSDETGAISFQMRIREDALWDNGEPITAADYLFTMKCALVPGIENASWSTFVNQIDAIELDAEDPLSLAVSVSDAYMQAEEIVTGFSVYPAYAYDPKHQLREISFSALKSPALLTRIDSLQLDSFATQFNSAKFSREVVVGSGPYEFVEWQAQQSLTLRKKSNWWGRNVDHPLLLAEPEEIKYYFIPEEQTALTSLKDAGIDLVSEISPEQFQLLKNQQNHSLKLKTPSVLQYFYIAYNNSHPALKDSKTRRAISHLMDLGDLIDELFYGQGLQTIGPVHPSKQAYAEDLSPLPLDPDLARSLLRDAGWSDSDGDGILDRTTTEGSRVDLDLRLFTTRSQLSQDVGVLLKQEAEKVGMRITIVPMDFRAMLQDVRAGQFEMACLASRPPIGDYDPYPNWHSANIGPQGNNLCRFANPEMDSIIESIRFAPNAEARLPYYRRFQEIIFEEQPALFLVAPAMRIAHGEGFDLITSSMRPGYFENTMAPF